MISEIKVNLRNRTRSPASHTEINNIPEFSIVDILGFQLHLDADAGFFAVRAALAKALGAPGAAPVAAKVIAAVAKPFAIRVTEKAAAQALPIIGAVGGAAINGVFMAHFQAMAHGHFTVRRLEQKYGPEAVKKAYESLE